jgi:hypothetical protein
MASPLGISCRMAFPVQDPGVRSPGNTLMLPRTACVMAALFVPRGGDLPCQSLGRFSQGCRTPERARLLREEDPPGAGRALLLLPRPRGGEAQGGAPPRHPGGAPAGRRPRPRDRPGGPSEEPPSAGDPPRGPGPGDALPRSGSARSRSPTSRTGSRARAPDPRTEGTSGEPAGAARAPAARKALVPRGAPRPASSRSQRPGLARRSPYDFFILAALEERGLRPARPADRRTLIRRATYDSPRASPHRRGGRGLRARSVPARLRGPRRPALVFAPLRRALGTLLARRRAVRRHQGLTPTTARSGASSNSPSYRDWVIAGDQRGPTLRPLPPPPASRPIGWWTKGETGATWPPWAS